MKRYFVIAIIAILFLTILYFGWNMFYSKNSQKGVNFSQEIGILPAATDPTTVELKNGDTYDLTASIVKKNIGGNDVKMLAYNGSIPGQLIKVAQNAVITVNFKNNTDVDSTIHSHGVRLDNQFDGVPDITQKAVKPGESFSYKMTFPDVGIYWYHPHVREDYAQELGLYGNFLVTPNSPDYWGEVDREETLFLDDILIEGGQIANFDKSVIDHTLMGRFGNTMFINGDDNYKLSVRQGERVRFYITNAANARVFNFTIPNVRMKLVGSDNGKYEHEQWVDSVIIGPSERQIVEIAFAKDGEYQILNQTPDQTYALGTIDVQKHPVTTTYLPVLRENQDLIDSLKPLKSFFNKPADKDLKLTLEMGSSAPENNSSMGEHMMGNGEMMEDREMSMGEVEKIEWEDDMGMMNVQSTTNTLTWKLIDQESEKENMYIGWEFKKGDTVKIKIFNDDQSMHPMQHPIHIHGQKFLVLSTNGQSSSNLVWKDTTLIQTGDTVELLTQMDNPGTWLIHCHIPEHMEAGMISQFEVI